MYLNVTSLEKYKKDEGKWFSASCAELVTPENRIARTFLREQN